MLEFHSIAQPSNLPAVVHACCMITCFTSVLRWIRFATTARLASKFPALLSAVVHLPHSQWKSSWLNVTLLPSASLTIRQSLCVYIRSRSLLTLPTWPSRFRHCSGRDMFINPSFNFACLLVVCLLIEYRHNTLWLRLFILSILYMIWKLDRGSKQLIWSYFRVDYDISEMLITIKYVTLNGWYRKYNFNSNANKIRSNFFTFYTVLCHLFCKIIMVFDTKRLSSCLNTYCNKCFIFVLCWIFI